MDASFFTRLLPDDSKDGRPHERLRAALAADPALLGRASCNETGHVVLTGPASGPAPSSSKERQRWEMHVRLRIAAELDPHTSVDVIVRWADAPGSDCGSPRLFDEAR